MAKKNRRDTHNPGSARRRRADGRGREAATTPWKLDVDEVPTRGEVAALRRVGLEQCCLLR